MGSGASKYFGKEERSPPKTCPVRHKKFENFATIAPSDTELEFYCPLCDTLVAREFDDMGTRKTEIYDREHMPD